MPMMKTSNKIELIGYAVSGLLVISAAIYAGVFMGTKYYYPLVGNLLSVVGLACLLAASITNIIIHRPGKRTGVIKMILSDKDDVKQLNNIFGEISSQLERVRMRHDKLQKTVSENAEATLKLLNKENM